MAKAKSTPRPRAAAKPAYSPVTDPRLRGGNRNLDRPVATTVQRKQAGIRTANAVAGAVTGIAKRANAAAVGAVMTRNATAQREREAGRGPRASAQPKSFLDSTLDKVSGRESSPITKSMNPRTTGVIPRTKANVAKIKKAKP